MAMHTVEVRITKVIEIDLPPECLTDNYLELVRKGLWEIGSHSELYELAAEHIAQYGACHVEGVGQPTEIALRELPAEERFKFFYFNEVSSQVETELLIEGVV
ncbi:hypothetical protein IGB42_02606 [Andreprevotia sp. IGB-42]|uniref:hypothetical protein n=1 Tax=Andreprevotia sp. IGB-42 TaxID=2497473 RepID=UPI0013580C5A|nr:hypothetical protein [Andreprevotia sp. IGB-42]KAF0812763.1 hypothetical protein IGB42_02606 [Andreprevotia sp. IGB-42]